MPTATNDRAPGSSSAGRQARRMRSAVSQAMPAASPRPSQASIRASASANGSALAMPTRSKPKVRASAFTARARLASIPSPWRPSVTQAEHGGEGFLGDLDAAQALHPLFTLGLLLQQLAL